MIGGTVTMTNWNAMANGVEKVSFRGLDGIRESFPQGQIGSDGRSIGATCAMGTGRVNKFTWIYAKESPVIQEVGGWSF